MTKMTGYEKVVAIGSVLALVAMAVIPPFVTSNLKQEVMWDAVFAIPFFICILLWYRALMKRTREG